MPCEEKNSKNMIHDQRECAELCIGKCIIVWDLINDIFNFFANVSNQKMYYFPQKIRDQKFETKYKEHLGLL